VLYTGTTRSEELGVLRMARLNASADDDTCPACNLELGLYKARAFHQPTNQYLCIRCHKRAKANNDVVVPIDSKKPRRQRDAEDLEIQKVCGVNWCPKETWVNDDTDGPEID
jgi:hypothetical protein